MSEAVKDQSPGAAWVPVLMFLVMAGFLAFALKYGEPQKLPSALIGHKVPEFTLPPVEGLKSGGQMVIGFSNEDLAQGKVSIVNVWASWCVPCHQEHPFLVRLKKLSGAPMFGINNKDRAVDARRFLGRYGNPFDAVGADRRGRVSIDWGVYGLPETFIVDGYGRITHKHVGPISQRDIFDKLLPAIEKARKALPPEPAADAADKTS